ncbi:hypothetical protein NHF48_018115 [Sphingomonas sp. H160509]|uniref:hypothetical protein n=1 Tax=Sphingomonas sp. H160509 TaxID=2955313 RepID=UPI00209847CD|nr:hypothetical protein [Sphingomonas sp. H160509]MDD1452400.1 hypothetical protein [Sphingomonas sp. H160509]
MTWAIIAIGFLVPVAVGLLTRFQPMIAGFLWPVVVAILTAIYVFAIEPRGVGEEPQKNSDHLLRPLLARRRRAGRPGRLDPPVQALGRKGLTLSLFSREGGSPVWIPAYAGKQALGVRPGGLSCDPKIDFMRCVVGHRRAVANSGVKRRFRVHQSQ